MPVKRDTTQMTHDQHLKGGITPMRTAILLAMTLFCAACAGPQKIISLPEDGAGAFVYDAPPVRGRSARGISIAVVKPQMEMRGRAGYYSAESKSGKTAVDRGTARSGASGASSVAGALYSDRRQVALQGEAEVDEKITALLNEFLGAAQRDCGLLLMANGFQTAGSFASISEMTFPDKRQATFALVSKLRFEVSKSMDREPSVLSPVEGQAEVMVEADLSLIEPLSGEKFWAKHLEFRPRRAPFTVKVGGGLTTQTIDARPEAVGRALELSYKEVMDGIRDAIDAEAWSALESDALTLKRKALTIMH
ncbi:MAG: hypothetical protein AAB289_10875 [Chloroflexota bacterium]